MGGSALKNFPTRRYQKEEFSLVQERVLQLLRSVNIDAAPLLYYREKETFGDLDVLVRWDKDVNLAITSILKLFRPQDFFINNAVLSLNVEELQVDFIITSSFTFPTSYHYFAYNDLGNFMGRIAKEVFDVKYGHDGLHANVKIGSNVIDKLEVSRDSKKIFEFLGFDYRRYMQGFDTLDDIFNYVINSLYFHPSYFALDKLNHINRTRNRKRANYSLFLEKIKDYDVKSLIPIPPHSVDSFFPDANIGENRNRIIASTLRYQNSKGRVIDILKSKGFTGKALGKAHQIIFHKLGACRDKYSEIVSNLTDEEVLFYL
jgi:hypothetical protein